MQTTPTWSDGKQDARRRPAPRPGSLRAPAAWIALVVIGAMLLSASPAAAGIIGLNADAQGSGNKGASFRPVDAVGAPAAFVLTSRFSIDHTNPFVATASGLAGTVYIDRKGGGVQTAKPDGSKGISGGGGHKDEELIFTYDSPVLLSGLLVGLNDIDFGNGTGDKDDPVIFLSLAGSGTYGVTILESEIYAAFTSTGRKQGTVDFGLFTSVSPSTGIDGFKVRETNDHIYVDVGTTGTPVPEPASLVLIAVGGCLTIIRRIRK